MDIEKFNADWLTAWTAKDVDGLLEFYAKDCAYFDPQVPAGIHGHDALKTYLTQMFGATPPMTYDPEKVWTIDGGFCGRWYCEIGGDEPSRMRGFDMVLIADGKIAHNEVYVHPLG